MFIYRNLSFEIESNVLSARLAEGGLVQSDGWLLASRGLLGDQSNTLLSWDNTNGLSINSISTIHFVPSSYIIAMIGIRFGAYLVVDETSIL
ncbi:hypothetical protein EYC80_006595 [Monilinia laxa]|uniref:Uncharacterized protein n=1 Tax=Monilinia laxa TaxID=61186 RepID=A0A5N6JTV1_MONLA|nr:hypothetical protein EYC80_006595 [Monilinia laxa]